MSTDNERSQQYWKEPPKETSYEAHLRRKRLKQQQRSRSPKTQGPNEEQRQETPYENDPRSRQSINQSTNRFPGADKSVMGTRELKDAPQAPLRPLQPHDTRLPEDYADKSLETEPSRRMGTRPPATIEVFPYETETKLPSELPRQRTRSIGDRGKRASDVRDRRVTEKTTRRLPEAKRRRAWPWLLAGCAGGILTIALIGAIILVIFFHSTLGGALFGGVFNQTFTQKNQQTFNISNFSLIQLNNNVGNVASNVTIVVDPTASITTLTTVKKVQAANSSDANKEFARIPLILSPVSPATPTLILTICSQDNTACGNIGDSVDVTITLPTSTNANGSYLFDIETRIGTISVQQAQLAAGSCLSTGTGNVTFKGSFDTAHSSNLNPCGQPTSNAHPWYKIHSEVGNLDITPFPTIKNVLLDASTTAGKINSDGFNLNIQTSNGSESYYGPLIPNTPQPPAELTLDVGSGDITLHKF